MALTVTKGDLLRADAEALVNAVNCVGVMGKGIALFFKEAYPDNFRQYKQACLQGHVQLGEMFTVSTGQLTNPKFIINFPTKNHWRDKAHLQDVQSGLVSLTAAICLHEITSLAIPALGCGNGSLDWNVVRPLIERCFSKMPEINVLLFEPSEP